MTDSHILKSLAALPLEHVSFISYSRTMCGSFQWFVRTPGGDALTTNWITRDKRGGWVNLLWVRFVA